MTTKFEVGEWYIRKEGVAQAWRPRECLSNNKGVITFGPADGGENGYPICFKIHEIEDLYIRWKPLNLAAQVCWVKYPTGLIEVKASSNLKFFKVGDKVEGNGVVVAVTLAAYKEK